MSALSEHGRASRRSARPSAARPARRRRRPAPARASAPNDAEQRPAPAAACGRESGPDPTAAGAARAGCAAALSSCAARLLGRALAQLLRCRAAPRTAAGRRHAVARAAGSPRPASAYRRPAAAPDASQISLHACACRPSGDDHQIGAGDEAMEPPGLMVLRGRTRSRRGTLAVDRARAPRSRGLSAATRYQDGLNSDCRSWQRAHGIQRQLARRSQSTRARPDPDQRRSSTAILATPSMPGRSRGDASVSCASTRKKLLAVLRPARPA